MKLYLSSMDYSKFEIPRTILWWEMCDIGNRMAMVAYVDTILDGQDYGYQNSINTFYLLDRFDINSFKSLENQKFPIDVHVLIPRVENSTISDVSQLKNIAWASLYDKLEDAIKHA